MTNPTVRELRTRVDAAWANLTRQLEGMEPYLERGDEPGEWTTRQVLAHLLFDPGWDATATLKKFAARDFPTLEIKPGEVYLTEERRRMTLAQLVDALDAQRRAAFAYVEPLPEAEIQERKVRIPALKPFLGVEEVPIAMYIGALLDGHWNDHAGQLAKIRKAVGLPDAK